jgi:hypothetical protein
MGANKEGIVCMICWHPCPTNGHPMVVVDRGKPTEHISEQCNHCPNGICVS